MVLHFSVTVPSTSAIHVVVMCGRVSAIAFRVWITVKIGVQGVHYSHCYAITACTRKLVCVCVHMDVCICITCSY